MLATALTSCASTEFTTSGRAAAESTVIEAVPSVPPSPAPTPTSTPPPVLLTPSTTTPTPVTKPVPVGAFVLGDSISLAVAPLLSRLGYPVVGRVGQSATDSYLRDNLSTDQAQAALAWIIVLGTNNRGDATDVAAIPRWLDLVDELRPGNIPVYWVTPYRPPTYTGGLSTLTLDEFNAALWEQAATRPWLGIVDFAAVARFHPEWFEADGAHLHPDAAGQGVLAAMIAGPDAEPAAAPAPVTSIVPTEPAIRPTAPEDEPTTFTNVPVASPPPSPEPAVPSAATPDSAPPPAASSAPIASAAPSG